MAIEFCPLAADVGNWADWAAVVVGLGAAVATIAVAKAANRTSKQAAEIARQAALIAQKQLDVAVETDTSNARIVGQLILHEVADLPCRIYVQYQMATRTKAYDSQGELRGFDMEYVFEAVRDSSTMFLPGAQQVQDRIHLLPNKLGERLAMVMGLGVTMNNVASSMLTRFDVKVLDTRRDLKSFRYNGNARDVDQFRELLKKLSTESISLAKAFGEYVELPSHDFEKWAIPSS
ncbi:TPA: hypothetical protein UOA91_002884 [Stenotrophomonas maltophilia]|nr:hypothetical protein [Stenotrophomonas maltophilia]HEL3778684.1 hypothetical protein [Stenotrophomonas maltophilia]HEL5006646.1 hypothetical protein [Stenotrophomonas maltophilia]